MRVLVYIVFMGVLFLPKLAAQTSQYLFSYLGEKDGLQEQLIHAVQQDTNGYIWIASHNHLQRYDGHRFLDFFPKDNDPSSIPPGGINGMLIDKKNRLWLLTGKATLGYLDVNNFTYHPIKVQPPTGNFSQTATAIHQDKDGHIMLIYVGKTFITFNESTNEFAQQNNPFQLPEGWGPIYLWQDDDRNYWIGAQQGLLKYNAKRKKFSYTGHIADNDPVIHQFGNLARVGFAYVDQQKRFWVTAWPNNNLVIKSFDPATGEVIEWKQTIGEALKGQYYEMHGITEMSDGSLWMAGTTLFAKINYPAKKIEPVPDNAAGEFSIRFDRILQLFEDREKNIWISTNKGLFRFNPSAQLFRVVNNRLPGSDSVYTPDVTDLLHMPDGTLLVSTWGNGIFAYDANFNPVKSNYVNRINPPGENMVWCMTRRKNGDTWRGSQEGYLFIYHSATGKTSRHRPSIFENSTIRQVEEDAYGNMWLGSQNGYLVKWNPLTDSFTLQHRLNAVVTRIYVDKTNDVWVCTDQAGVFRFNAVTGAVKATYSANGPKGKSLRSNGARDIIQYNDSLFIIASDGLNILNQHTHQFKYFTTQNGLPSSNIQNLEKDSEGYVWVSSARGISSYHPFKEKLSSYNASDGVHTNSFNIASSTVLNNGHIAFGTNHDYIVFDPRKVTVENYTPPKVVITGFELMNKRLLADSLLQLPRIKLSYMEHSITIELSTLTFQNIYPVYYMMEGMDKEWVKAGTLLQAGYNYMPPGKHRFKTSCKDVNGKFGHVTYLEIYITPPFWKTWWFVSLLAFAAISFLYWMDKMRVDKIRDTERVRTRIATSLTKDMSSTLSTINLLSELAKVKADKDIERTKEYISQISDNSNRMMEAMDDMIWSINPENDELQYTIQRMKKYAAQIQTNYNLEVSFTVDEKVNEIKLHMDRRHELFLIFKEAMLNIGKHAACKFADVHITYQHHKLKMKLIDNGKGFDVSGAGFGRGISEMRKKAELINGQLTITSEINTGTTVDFTMAI